jgi:hypothetical protein
MIQHWEAKHNMPLFPNSEENKNIRKRSWNFKISHKNFSSNWKQNRKTLFWFK